MALGWFPVLIGITKQAHLHELHLKLGYQYRGEIPALWDGETAREYVMTRESRANAKLLKYPLVKRFAKADGQSFEVSETLAEGPPVIH